MNKRLLKEDYLELVFTSFSKQKEDLEKYYLNIVDEHREYNEDILLQLKNVLNEWIYVCRKNARKHHVPDFDDAGNEIEEDFDAVVTTIYAEKYQPILIDEEVERFKTLLGGQAFKDRRVIKFNVSYFKWQIGIVDKIRNNELKAELIQLEESLPDLYRNALPPLPEYCDLEILKDRLRMLQMIPEINEIVSEELRKVSGENKLVFKEDVLLTFYNDVNGLLKESIDFKLFEPCFRVEPISQIKSVIGEGKLSKFCQSLKLIQDKRDKKLVPNFERWMNNAHGVTSWKDISKTYEERYKNSK
ncbi:MAG: hypothetical protein ACK5JD_08300 [Mangrovibacterium sp.]